MPGMMDTVLNLGINDQVATDLIEWSGDSHFAWDAYRRFAQMYGEVVMGVPEHLFQEVLGDMRSARGVHGDSELSSDDLEHATRRFQEIIQAETGTALPTDPHQQLRGAIEAVLSSWNNLLARDDRRHNGIPDDIGTAANVQMMVFGDLGTDSGTGVCFTRDPATGENRPYGNYLAMAQGEDVVAGIRTASDLDERWTGSSGTTPTCATSSSPSSGAGSTSSRPGPASAPPPPRSASPSTSPTPG
jgi:pyruvate,orthophosphate dikinase